MAYHQLDVSKLVLGCVRTCEHICRYSIHTDAHTHLMGIVVNDFLPLHATYLNLPPVDQRPGSPKRTEFPEKLKLTPFLSILLA